MISSLWLRCLQQAGRCTVLSHLWTGTPFRGLSLAKNG